MTVGKLQQRRDPVRTMHARYRLRGLLDGAADGGDEERSGAPAARDRNKAVRDFQRAFGNADDHGRVRERCEEMGTEAFARLGPEVNVPVDDDGLEFAAGPPQHRQQARELPLVEFARAIRRRTRYHHPDERCGFAVRPAVEHHARPDRPESFVVNVKGCLHGAVPSRTTRLISKGSAALPKANRVLAS